MKDVPNKYGQDEFGCDFGAFLYGVANEQSSEKNAKEILKNTFNIDNYNGNLRYKGDLWKEWEFNLFYIVDEQTEEYVDITYYADSIYLTPAKKMRYYIKENSEFPMLISTELLVDYGFEPLKLYYVDR